MLCQKVPEINDLAGIFLLGEKQTNVGIVAVGVKFSAALFRFSALTLREGTQSRPGGTVINNLLVKCTVFRYYDKSNSWFL